MKITRTDAPAVPPPFRPFTLQVTVETLEEAKALRDTIGPASAVRMATAIKGSAYGPRSDKPTDAQVAITAEALLGRTMYQQIDGALREQGLAS